MVKGVIARINPDAHVIDLCHDVEAQDVKGAAFLLAGAFSYFPRGTIHVAVVDPTVGTERPALCIESDEYFFIGPDNGVLSVACARAGHTRIFQIERYALERRARTFHGRDIFAPAAAHLSGGANIESVGRRIESMQRISVAVPAVKAGTVEGEIVHVDRFGNLITNIAFDLIERTFAGAELGDFVITCGSQKLIGLNQTYGDVPVGSYVALFSSYDLLEIAVREGNASVLLSVGRGDRVTLEGPKR